MKSRYKIYILIFIIIIGYAIPIFLINDKVNAACKEDVITHFDNPLQRLLTIKTVAAAKRGTSYFVRGYTFFGIILTEAECHDSNITTTKSLFF